MTEPASSGRVHPRRSRAAFRSVAVALLVAAAAASAPAQEAPRRRAGPERGPCAALSVIVGCPAERSVTMSIRSETAVEACVETGAAGTRTSRTPVFALPAGTPVEVPVAGLAPDARTPWRLLTRRAGETSFAQSAEGSFRTLRAPGSAFTFTVQGDSHPERLGKMFDPDLYVTALRNVAADAPDFHFTLGDDFSIERLIERGTVTQPEVDAVYAHQRGYLGLVGASSALFLVNGNHEQAARYLLDGTATNPAVCAGRARISHFPLPEPGGIYTGDAEEIPHVGRPRDYYAWTWGDALFVVLDPYWHSAAAVDNEAGSRRSEDGGKKGKGGRGRDLWSVGIGDAQYRWLRTTLETSRARWKFVFAHHVLGTGRGGIEQAGLFEWGGADARGVNEFAARRPGWELPIHALFVKTGVTAFFQGHDHIFARQELDGVVYQSVPNPGDATYTAFNREAYRSGDVLPNSGHVRVRVAPDGVKVDYVRAVLPGEESRAGAKNGDVSLSYGIAPRAGAAK